MEIITLNKNDIKSFKEFISCKDIKLLKKVEESELVSLTYNSDQKFILDKSLYSDIFKYENDLIFGKDKTERVVSVEIDGDNLVLFIQNEDGTISTDIRKNTFWFLTNEKLSNKQTRLKGDQQYKWAALFDNHEDFQKALKTTWKKDVYTIWDPKEAALVYNGITYFKGMKPSDVSVLAFDIETNGIVRDDSSYIFCISNTYRKNGTLIRKLFSEEDYVSQGEMLIAWCDWIRTLDPSIIINHNIYGFDLDYIYHISLREKISLNLGRNGSSIIRDERESKFRKDATQFYTYHNFRIFGREIVDTMFLSYHFDIGKKYESYGLKQIIKQEGLEKTNRSFYDASLIRENWKIPSERLKIKEYVKDDSDDALALFDLMCPTKFYFTQSVSKPFQSMFTSAMGSQLNTLMVRSYLQIRHSIAKTTEVKHFEGGISIANPGIYSNGLKWDLSSAYPFTIIQYNLYNKMKDPNGNFLNLVKFFTNERIKNKKLAKETGDNYYKDLEQSQKLAINSFFGYCGTPGLNYNAPEIAARITRECRGYIETAIKWATGKTLITWKNELINNETDCE